MILVFFFLSILYFKCKYNQLEKKILNLERSHLEELFKFILMFLPWSYFYQLPLSKAHL